MSGKKALEDAGLGMGTEAFEKLDKSRCGVLIGTGMGGLKVFQDGVQVGANPDMFCRCHSHYVHILQACGL